MNRCVIIHRTGDAEVRDIHPIVHQQLRGLGHRRFVLKFVRTIDGRMLTSAIYSHIVPSPHQATAAVEQLFGRAPGSLQLFDEDGHEINGNATPALGVAQQPPMPRASSPVPQQPPPAPRVSSPTPSLPGRAISHERIAVKTNDLSVVAQCPDRADLPLVRLHAEVGRGWVVEVSTRTSEGQWRWEQVLTLPGAGPEGREK